MNIPSFKKRKRVSIKERHYILYGLLMRDETEKVGDIIVSDIPTENEYCFIQNRYVEKPNKYGEEMLKILKKYSLKFRRTPHSEIIVEDYKERFLKKYRNFNKAPKYMTKRIHILGLSILFLGNLEFANGRIYANLKDFLSEKDVINIIVRLQDFDILTQNHGGNISFDKEAIKKMIEYEEFYNVLVFRGLVEEYVSCNTQPTFYIE